MVVTSKRHFTTKRLLPEAAFGQSTVTSDEIFLFARGEGGREQLWPYFQGAENPKAICLLAAALTRVRWQIL